MKDLGVLLLHLFSYLERLLDSLLYRFLHWFLYSLL
jgi:hypothetical protein